MGYTGGVTKPMKYLKLVRLLRKAGFVLLPDRGKGSHEVWEHPSGIQAILVYDTECSPGIVRKALEAIDKVKELQK